MLLLNGLSLKKKLVAEIFALGEITTSPAAIKSWRTTEANTRANYMPDVVLNGFLDGLFKYRDIQAKNNMQVFAFEEIGARRCGRCGYLGTFIDNGETCANCKLVQ